jgi:putative restriction endonuclease
MLASPFFLSRNDWIPAPGDWSPNLVQGKTYDTDEDAGAALWHCVQERLNREPTPVQPEPQLPLQFQDLSRYGSIFLNGVRPGPGAFRVNVTEAYNRSCAVTGVRTLPVLQATHIKPPSRSGSNQVSNGILLRADLRLLFEAGLMTIDPTGHVEMSRRLHEFQDAAGYEGLHGSELKVLPVRPLEQPAPELLEWHNANVFLE